MALLMPKQIIESHKMNFYRYLIILAIIIMNQNCVSQNLSDYQWQNRLVLLITNNTNSALHLNQLEELKINEPGLEERKILCFLITPEKYKSYQSDHWLTSSELYNKYKKSNTPFEFILIGLDGGVKLRRSNFVSCEDLFAIIDVMPMRQNEIKNKYKK